MLRDRNRRHLPQPGGFSEGDRYHARAVRAERYLTYGITVVNRYHARAVREETCLRYRTIESHCLPNPCPTASLPQPGSPVSRAGDDARPVEAELHGVDRSFVSHWLPKRRTAAGVP